MPPSTSSRRNRTRRTATVTVVAVTALGLAAAMPTPALAAVPPVYAATSKVVTADALPTAQIDGIVWKQVIAGNTVFAGGQFTSARPAGAAPGTRTSPRSNLMSYDVRTGTMKRFAPKLNGQVRALATSPDKKTLYVGGDFTKVGDASRPSFAAFEIATGKLLKTRVPLNSRVNAITTLGRTVYLGGWFTRVGTTSRKRLAAVDATTGKLTGWNPEADRSVQALTATADKKRIIIGGTFSTLKGKKARGMGAVTTGVGAVRTWKASAAIQAYGANAAVLSLAVDKDTVYGTAYGYEDGNFEGVFAASPTDGTIKWLQDCHGDQYDVAPVGDLVYSVGHAHYCENIGAFPEISPQRALVATKTARGTVAENGQIGSHYEDWAGYKAPALINWFPRLNTGTVSGSTQGAWSVAATTRYVVLGGEFTTVNGQPQQGLVRFTTPGNGAPQRVGPQQSGARMGLQVYGQPDGTGREAGWNTNYDLDDENLRYELLRDGRVVASRSKKSNFWSLPWMTIQDDTAQRGVSYRYQLRVTDPDGNAALSSVVTTG